MSVVAGGAHDGDASDAEVEPPSELYGAARGKSDRIDAISVARAALAAAIEALPTAALAGPELDVRLLVDYRE